MSYTVGSTVFGGEPCAGGVVGAKDVDIDKAWEVTVWGFVSLVWAEIVFLLLSWGGHLSTPLLMRMECKRVYCNQLRVGCGQMLGVLTGS